MGEGNHGTGAVESLPQDRIAISDKNTETAEDSLESHWLSWGTYLFESIRKVDRGIEWFHRVLNAREQLERLVRKVYTRSSIYIFGSIAVHQLWDGDADVDFSCLDTAEWLKGKDWPPDERIAVLKVSSVLGFVLKPFQITPLTSARTPIIKYAPPKEYQRGLDVTNHESLRSVTIQMHGQRNSMKDEPSDHAQVHQQIDNDLKDLLSTRNIPISTTVSEDNQESVDATGQSSTSLKWTLKYGNVADALDTLVEVKKRTYLGPKRIERTYLGPIESFPGHIDLSMIEFDLSFRILGLRNSYLLQAYMKSHPIVRPGALFLKQWSKSTALNDSQNGWLCTYAFNIMWLHYLLHTGLVSFVPPESIPFDPSFLPQFPEYRSLSLNDAEAKLLGRHVYSFFMYFGEVFDWSNHVATINRREVTHKEALQWETRVTAPQPGSPPGGTNSVPTMSFATKFYNQMCIEDPYEVDFNLGRFISESKLEYIQKLMKDSAEIMKCENDEPSVQTLLKVSQVVGNESFRPLSKEGERVREILRQVLPEESATLDVRNAVTLLKQSGIRRGDYLSPSRLPEKLQRLGFAVMNGRVVNLQCAKNTSANKLSAGLHQESRRTYTVRPVTSLKCCTWYNKTTSYVPRPWRFRLSVIFRR